MEQERRKDDKWVEEWNNLIDRSKKLAGCLKREKYDKESIRETKGEDKVDKSVDSKTVPPVSGDMAGEEACIGSIGNITGEGSIINLLSPHITEKELS